MTEDDETPDRRNLLLGQSTNDALEELADEYHDGNESAAARDAIHFAAKWKMNRKSLPAEILHSIQRLEEIVRELVTRVETLEGSVENAEAAASDAPAEEVNIARLKREVRYALSESGARRIESLAEELGAPISEVRESIHQLEDKSIVQRTDDGKAPQFELYE